jgi:putative two-component system response regulator
MELEAAGFEVITADNGLMAIDLARDNHYELIICDIRMPGIDGLETVQSIKEFQPGARNILITGYASPDAPITALKLKVDDYLLKPFSSEEFLHSVHSALLQYQQRKHQLLHSPGTFKGNLTKLVMAIFYESHISYLGGHSERLARNSLRIARSLNFSPLKAQNLYLAALLHDIGQAELPYHLLESRDLRHDDRELIKNHPSLGRDLLAPFDELKEIATIILHHHEKWDGSGYPRGLRGEEIPLESRIIAIAEAYDSLVTGRPYRGKKSSDDTIRLMEKEKGKNFDPALLEIFTRILEDPGGDSNDEPLPGPEESAGKALFLLAMAEMYREAGSLEIAGKAYDNAETLLGDGDSPELLQRAKLGKALIFADQGMHREALELAMEARELARVKSLQFDDARVTLTIATLKMHLKDYGCLEDDLLKARHVFSIWESHYEICLTDFLLSALHAARGSDLPHFSLHFNGFLDSAFRGRFYDIMEQHQEYACQILHYALKENIHGDRISLMIRESSRSLFPVLEKMMLIEDTEVKERLLDMLAEMKEERLKALLSRARTDEDSLVSEKSALLMRSGGVGTSFPLLRLHFLGRFKVMAAENPIDDELWITRKTRSLFAYLASRRGETKSEEVLMDLFWEQGGDKARHSLHNSISQIRKLFLPSLGPDSKNLVMKKRDGYLFSKDALCWIDLEDFDMHYYRGKSFAEQKRWEEALHEFQHAERLYRGEFMEGSYEEWSFDLRLKSRDKLLQMLLIMGRYFFEKRKFEVSIDCWKKLLCHDNCSEDAFRGLILCHGLLNNQGEALKIYHECVKTLKKELDMPPPPKIMEIYLALIEGKHLVEQW